MSNRVLFLDKFTESLASVSKYNLGLSDDEDSTHKRMIFSLKNIVRGELTKKQQICLQLYYGDMMKMKDIAIELGIGVSSVSRHIKKAKNRVEKTMKYYFQ